jgi:hypothetical protein
MSRITGTGLIDRRRYDATIWYLCALHGQAGACPPPPKLLEELEVDARFELEANEELRA